MKRITSISIFCLILVFLFTSCLSGSTKKVDPKNLSADIHISGAWALYPMTLVWAEEFMKQYPNVNIQVEGGGAGLGINETMSKENDLGMLSFDLTQGGLKDAAYTIPVVRDAVVVTCNPKNPYLQFIYKNGMNRKQLEDIFINGTIKDWKQLYPTANLASRPLNVYTRGDNCGAATVFASYLNGSTQNDLVGEKYNGDLGMLDAVANDKNGIGYNNIAFAYDISTRKTVQELTIIPIDMNENGILESQDEGFFKDLDSLIKIIEDERYPQSPARNLYLVSNGKPTNPAVLAFLEYILTEGQKLVHKNGYAELDKDVKAEALRKLKEK